MHPPTVIVVLALHLVSLGGLMYLIGRRMPPRSGLPAFAAGAIVFGCAYALRLVTGLTATTSVGVVVDTLMVLATLLFIGGLRQFVGRDAWRLRSLLAAMAGFVLLHLLMVGRFGALGRHVVLNVGLGALYALLAVSAARESGREEEALRVPLRVLAAVMGLLALLTLARAGIVAQQGVDALFNGTAAQVYYAYASLAAVLLGPNLLWMVFARLNGQLADLASRDALTRVLNRNGLDGALRQHFGSRGHEPMTLLQVDIDHFKRINDDHGHAAGDAVLRAVAHALDARVRAGDFVARTGGEEFLVGFVGGSREPALAFGERLRSSVAALATPAPDGRAALRCTVSIGVSQPFAVLADWEHAARQADHALYAAKQAGRDRVVAAT
ncbi:MAG: GGDEF domain-containing protein [Burkholderiaceae bacterium]